MMLPSSSVVLELGLELGLVALLEPRRRLPAWWPSERPLPCGGRCGPCCPCRRTGSRPWWACRRRRARRRWTTGIGISLSMMPPCMVARVARWCFLATLRPSTMTLPSVGEDAGDLALLAAVLALEDPDAVALLDLEPGHQITSGASDTIFMNFFSRSSRPTGPKMRVPAGVELVVDEHGGVLVEADVAAVGTAPLLLDADDDALHDVALLHAGAGDGVLDGGDEDVADRGVAALGAAEHPDAQHLLGAAVVGDAEARSPAGSSGTAPGPRRGASASASTAGGSR